MNWNAIKDFYYRVFEIEGKYVDLMASYDILLLSASGVCNETIAYVLEVSLEVVREEVKKYFNFTGYSNNLSINPLSVLRELKENGDDSLEKFCYSLPNTGLYVLVEVECMYRVAKLFEGIRKDLEANWV